MCVCMCVCMLVCTQCVDVLIEARRPEEGWRVPLKLHLLTVGTHLTWWVLGTELQPSERPASSSSP